MFKISLSTSPVRPIERQDDGDGLRIIWSGGLQTAEAKEDNWHLMPVLAKGRACSSGPYTKRQMQQLLAERGIRFVAFQHIHWTNGAFGSSWVPLVPGETNFMLGPADRWGNVASHLARQRLRETPPDLPAQEWLSTLDARSEPERLAQSISLSLHNVGTAVERIAEFYHEELVNMLCDGRIDGTRMGTTRSQELYAHVHSFFAHIGTARDYLATFVALQLGFDHRQTDDLMRLLGKIRTPDVERNPILSQLRVAGCLSPKQGSEAKWEADGWLKDITVLRNMFVHKRTYGQWTSEAMGHLEPVDSDAGLYRYVRPVVTEKGSGDVLDLIIEHYQRMTKVFHDAVLLSGLNSGIPVLTDQDIISVRMT